MQICTAVRRLILAIAVHFFIFQNGFKAAIVSAPWHCFSHQTHGDSTALIQKWKFNMKSASISPFSFEMRINLMETPNRCSVLKIGTRGYTHLELIHWNFVCNEVIFLLMPHLEIIYFQFT